MKHKNISFQSSTLLRHFIALNRSCFDITEAKKVLDGKSENAAWELVSDMTKRGLLMRLRQGRYYIIPFEQDPVTFMPNWHLLAECLVKDRNHYIGYYSALQLHNLTTQPALNEIVVTDRQFRPATIKVKAIKFQFIYHNQKHFFGVKKIWVDSYHKALCSDLEKTFVDCLYKPEHAGGIVETGKALFKAKESINYDRLLEYCKRFDSQAVIKRLGFLLELLKIENPIIDKLQKLKSKSYIQLDTEMLKIGTRLSRWSIQQNIDPETIQASILT